MRVKFNRTQDRVYLAILCGAVVATGLTGCGKNAAQQRRGAETEYLEEAAKMSNPREDIDVLKRWFPNLEGVVSALWEGEVMGIQDNTIPGPSTIHACGFIYLKDDMASQYLEKYTWTEENPNIKITSFDASAYENHIWYASEEFENDCKPMYFSGRFYFDGSCIWFDVIK